MLTFFKFKYEEDNIFLFFLIIFHSRLSAKIQYWTSIVFKQVFKKTFVIQNQISAYFVQKYSNLTLVEENIILWLITNIGREIFPHYAMPVWPIKFIKLLFNMLWNFVFDLQCLNSKFGLYSQQGYFFDGFGFHSWIIRHIDDCLLKVWHKVALYKITNSFNM